MRLCSPVLWIGLCYRRLHIGLQVRISVATLGSQYSCQNEGWRVDSRYYQTHIEVVMESMVDAQRDALPENRLYIAEYLNTSITGLPLCSLLHKAVDT